MNNKDKRITILYVCPDASLGGSTQSMINMIESIREIIKPIVLLPSQDTAYNYLMELGIDCLVHPYVLLHHIQPVSWKRTICHPKSSALYRYFYTDWNCVRWVTNKLKNQNIEIVHSNFSSVTVGALLARKLNAKHIWHIREFLDLDFNFNVFLGISRLRRIINRADARIVISSKIAEYWNFKKNSTFLLFNAIASESEVCYDMEKEKYILFCSYYITEKKGARRAVVAFGMSGMWKEGYRIKLLGNCNEDYMSSLMETAKKFRCEDFVDFIPCQKKVKPFFQKATAYIMASDCEAFGRVTAEAMFWGCPIIAHATGGTLDLVKNGNTGWLYYSEKECAKLIRKVCNESQENIIINAQNFALKNLTREYYGPKITKIYFNILNH